MISRYSRPEMQQIWTDEARFAVWFDIEASAAEAMAELGKIPQSAAENIRQRGTFDTSRILEIEKTTKHDVIAFLTDLADSIGEDSRFVHLGMTSSDVLDTCLAVQLSRAADLLLQGINRVLAALKARAHEHKNTMCIGRSHGMHAEPTSMGLKFAGHYAEFIRNRTRMLTARAEISTCALSGAVGNFAHLSPQVEARVAEKLGLQVETVSTQVIPRDRHAAFFATLGIIAAGIERFVVEVRHMQRTEVGEAEEAFGEGQKGSSAMPHKRNPVLSENLTGLSRLIRSYVSPALENVILWHERDISHSSVERVIAPDATIALDFALQRLGSMIENLVIFPERCSENLARSRGLYASQQILLHLVSLGITREDAYPMVQKPAMRAWQDSKDFQQCLLDDSTIRQHLDTEAIATFFDLTRYTRHLDVLFGRIFA
ncbi:MAG: adenylosuccinate lyase [Alphaproteobacteria bacterium]|nr:adenylosuccinate lyase [Alphaproteobacteria bacterium]